MLKNFCRPQSVRSNFYRFVQAVRDFIEQVCVDVESHRRLRVSQHPLHGLDVGTPTATTHGNVTPSSWSALTVYRVLAEQG